MHHQKKIGKKGKAKEPDEGRVPSGHDCVTVPYFLALFPFGKET